MKKLNLFFLIGLVAFITSSCSTYKHSYRLSDVPKTRIGVTPTVVDVTPDFNKQVSGESDKRTNSIQDAKDNAYYNAIVQNKIDVLVDPIYKVKVRKGLFRTTAKAEVTGFAGEFKNPRTLFENQEAEFDAKLESLKKLVSIEEIKNEERNSVIITTGQNGSTTTVNTAPSFVEQFNSLFNDTPIDFGNKSDNSNSNIIEEPKKRKGLFGLFGK